MWGYADLRVFTEDTILYREFIEDLFINEDAKVLVVDDDEITIQILKTAINKYDISTVRTGAQAIEFCRATPPDLVLLDIEMPSMDGFQVCSTLKADEVTADIPVIFITSHGSREVEDKGWKVGCVDFIRKPISIGATVNRINSQLTLKFMSDKLKGYAYQDGLTALNNRRHFDMFLSTQIKLATRNHTPLGLLIVDIDHFKKFNDEFGHLAGDDCLKEVAKVLQQSANRPTDFSSRYGGEEFSIVLPSTDKEGVFAVATRIAQAVRDIDVERIAGIDASITVSIGAAMLCGDSHNDAESLIGLADQRLYQAKNNGRNRIVFDEPVQ
jgi:diguanylate cyclase (GGDEF)-like protein